MPYVHHKKTVVNVLSKLVLSHCSMPQQADAANPGSSAVSRAFEQALPLMLHWAYQAGTGTAEVSACFLKNCMTACIIYTSNLGCKCIVTSS